MAASVEANEQPKCIFSTDLGRIAPRPAVDPPNRPLPACVIVRSHPMHEVTHFAEALKAQFPVQCREIYAGFHRSDFFDPYDVHLYGAAFLDAVLTSIAEPNNRRVVEFATNAARMNTDGMMYLSSAPIHSTAELTSWVCKLFDMRTINTCGPRMLGHVVHHLKYTMSQFHKEQILSQKDKMPDKNATPTQSPDEKRTKSTMNGTAVFPRVDAPGSTNAVNGTITRVDETGTMSRMLQPSASLPKPTPKRFLDDVHRTNHIHDMRRTASAEQTIDQSSATARQKLDRNAGRASYRVTSGPGQYQLPQGPMSVPPTPVMHASTSVQPRVPSVGARQPPMAYGNTSGMPPQMPQPQYYDSFNQFGQSFEHARFQGQTGQMTSAYVDPTSVASNYSQGLNANRMSSYYPAPAEGPGVPATYYPTAPTPFQGQLPLPPPLSNTLPGSNYGDRTNASFPRGSHPNRPMWDPTNQSGVVTPYVGYQAEPTQEKSGRFNHSDTRGHFNGRGYSRGQSSNGPSGRGGSYQKANGSRRFSVGSTNNRGRKGAGHGSFHADTQTESKPAVQASEGKPQTGFAGSSMPSDTQKVSEPFPDFGSPVEKRHGNGMFELPEDREHGCSPHYIGPKRVDIKDVWVQGFPSHLGQEGAEQVLRQLFQAVAPVCVISVTIRPEPGVVAFAFVTFNSTADVRHALTLNGTTQLGTPLRVQVPEKYHDGFKDRRQSKSGNWTNGQIPGYRRPSGQNYHGQRSSIEGRGSFTGTQPVYMSQEYAQSLGHGSPQTPFHPNQRRTSGYPPSYVPGSARRALPNGANAEFIQRLKTSSSSNNTETATKDSTVSYSPQDCRSSIPELQVDRNVEPNSSPERKKKFKKNRVSPEKPETVQETAPSEASIQNAKDGPSQANSQTTTQCGEVSEKSTSDSANVEESRKSVDESTDASAKKSDGEVKTQVDSATSSASPEGISTDNASPAAVEDSPGSPKTPQSPRNSSTGVQEPYLTPPETKHRTDDSFYSALEEHTPNDTLVENSDSADSPVTVIASTETVVPEIKVFEDHTAAEEMGEAAETVVPAADKAKEEIDSKETVAGEQAPADQPASENGPADALDEAKSDTKTTPVEPRLEEKRKQAATPEPSPSAAAQKIKSPKATPPPNQGALHPFAKANQVKKSNQTKKQKKKEKAKAKKHTKDTDRTVLGDINVNSVKPPAELSTVLESNAGNADHGRVDSPVEPAVPSAVSAPASDATKPQPQSTAKAPNCPGDDKKPADENPAVKKEEDVEKKEDKPKSPEKKPKEKSTLASKAAKLVALPDLGMLRRGTNAAKGNAR